MLRPGHGVDLQEHVAGAQGRALVMGDDDLDLLHVGHHRGDDYRRHRVYRVTASRCPWIRRTSAPAEVHIEHFAANEW